MPTTDAKGRDAVFPRTVFRDRRHSVQRVSAARLKNSHVGRECRRSRNTVLTDAMNRYQL